MLTRLTGSGGDTPIQDGTARGTIAAAATALLAFVNNKADWLTDADVITLAPVVVFLAFALAGAWDRYIKPRLAKPPAP